MMIELVNQQGVQKRLANGWRWVKLGDVCDFVGGMQPPKSTFKNKLLPGYVRLVQIQDFRRSDVAVYVPIEEAKRTFDESDVMIGRYGPPLFQILRGLSGAYNVALIKTVPKDGLIKDYLYYLLQEPSLQKMVIDQSQRAAGQTGVQKTFLENLLIPLPSQNEQKRIAAILKNQMADVERLRQITQAQLEAARALPAAYLRKLFNSLEAQDWVRKKLGDICSRITDGTHQSPSFTNGGIPFLFVRNIVSGYIDFNVTHYVSRETYQELTCRCRPEQGDLLYSAVGSFGVAVVIETDQPFIFQRHIALIKPKKEQIYPHFLACYLNSPIGRKQSKLSAMGVAQLTVTLTALFNFEVPIPPLAEQKRIAAILIEKKAEAEQLCKILEARLDGINQLPASLLRQAFNGEI